MPNYRQAPVRLRAFAAWQLVLRMGSWPSLSKRASMITVRSFSEVGGHLTNEDAFAVQAHPIAPDCWLCILADGQGGQPGGGAAAKLACQSAIGVALTHQPESLLEPPVWNDVLRKADVSAASDAAAGFTTLIALCVYRNLVVGASSGDSAVLLISAGEARELTSDQEKNPPVGSARAAAVAFATQVTPPWRLLVMSDGVWKYAGWPQLIDIAMHRPGADLVEELKRAARLPSGRFQDDFTVVVFDDDGNE